MTREEELIAAANLYEKENDENRDWTSFYEGAEWADTHPKSPWISVEDDLPCNHEELIITDDSNRKETISVITIDKYKVIEDNYMILCDDGKWKWKYGAVPLYWMPIPKLPKLSK